MSLEVKIHDAQTSILRELLFHPTAGFAQLQKPTSLTSDHFNFHISRLIELNLVEKVARGEYKLSPKGKEYANRLDTDDNTVERQPKTAVVLGLRRIHRGQLEYVFQQRRKNPYFGFWGFPGGKIRWGETIAEAAARETLEETGLSADFEVASVYHEHVLSAETDKFIEDKLFFMVRGNNVTGKLTEDFEGGHNQWRSPKSFAGEAKKYASFQTEIDLMTTKNWFHEQTIKYTRDQF